MSILLRLGIPSTIFNQMFSVPWNRGYYSSGRHQVSPPSHTTSASSSAVPSSSSCVLRVTSSSSLPSQTPRPLSLPSPLASPRTSKSVSCQLSSSISSPAPSTFCFSYPASHSALKFTRRVISQHILAGYSYCLPCGPLVLHSLSIRPQAFVRRDSIGAARNGQGRVARLICGGCP